MVTVDPVTKYLRFRRSRMPTTNRSSSDCSMRQPSRRFLVNALTDVHKAMRSIALETALVLLLQAQLCAHCSQTDRTNHRMGAVTRPRRQRFPGFPPPPQRAVRSPCSEESYRVAKTDTTADLGR